MKLIGVFTCLEQTLISYNLLNRQPHILIFMKKASFVALLVSSIFLSVGPTAVTAASSDGFAVATAEANIYEYITEKTKTEKANTSDKLDAVIRLGMADAKNINDAKVQEAIDWIASHSQTLCASNQTMETAFYYGSLLDEAFENSDARSQVGWYAVRATKYVYRGVEKATDPATLRSIKKLQKALDKLK